METSKAEMRVKIAKDALAQMKFISPTSNIYISFDDALPFGSLQQILEEKKPTCEACAIGSLFLAHVHLNNQFNIDSEFPNFDRGKVCHVLETYFSKEQLDDIEAAFEGWKESRDFYGFYADNSDYDRLRLILENIIANDGDFVSAALEFDEREEINEDDNFFPF